MRASQVIAELEKLVADHGDPVIYAPSESACGCCMQDCKPITAPAYMDITQDGNAEGWVL